MNKIKLIITILILSISGISFADSTSDIKAEPSIYESICTRGCTSIEPEVRILNTRNRFTETGALQRRLYPRFRHASIIKERVLCDCIPCHFSQALTTEKS